MTLEARWQRLWTELGLPAPAGLLPALLQAYSEPQRHYHTLQHLDECFAHFDAVKQLAEHPLEVELALWFHDSVYDVHARDNEVQSAAWADRALLDAGLPNDACARIHVLIMATCHDALPASNDARLLTDIDLAILGAAPARFAEYEVQIRREYAHVPPALFTARRSEILQAFLERTPLFQAPACRDRFEAAARRNLAGAIAAR
ncbi:N-methyl-D-aspartate receptor NMDAR2C subunit [Massilia sp. IC2-278]|uniref:HD domain-containing protein n=1 Tax=Massilia sp. IC2-278 TaxID=2887200 RepID=UPI001E347043|nr:N-methyl-D-aspartate receptor NMDAR2C subunit [Massilia sp. IC2-278]MCC2960788.1 N-methyl-D-aspartate receptor NMDAR2C subunit [Massilia sp. IC2-278]